MGSFKNWLSNSTKRSSKKGNTLRRSKRRAWALCQAPKQLLRTRKIKKRLKHTRRHGSGSLGSRPVGIDRFANIPKQTAITIELEEILSLHADHYELTIEKFTQLRRSVEENRRIRSLDFSRIRHISPSAALILASEVDRWNQSVGQQLRARTETWHPDITKLLGQMGYFELLKIERPAVEVAEKSTTFLRFIAGGTDVDDSGSEIISLREGIEQIVGHEIERRSLFEGLSEAVTNVSHHAYDSQISPNKPWWMSASYNKRTRELRVTFYDHGIGIPTHLWLSGRFRVSFRQACVGAE